MNFVETFRQLLAAASPSGYEGPEAQVIRQLAQPYCDQIRTDALGNAICHKKGAGRKMMFAAHMDVIGFMVTHFEENGFVGVTNVGGHTRRALEWAAGPLSQRPARRAVRAGRRQAG